MPDHIIEIAAYYCLTMISNKHTILGIPIWFTIAGMIGAGAFAIAIDGSASHQETPPDIQETSDVKIHLEKVDGKIHTNVPVTASRTFSALPIHFILSATGPTVTGGSSLAGSSFSTPQKAVINFFLDVSELAEVTYSLENDSEDTQLALFHCNTTPHVALDLKSGTGTTVTSLTGHNEWIMSVAAGTGSNVVLDVFTTDAGMFPIVCHIQRAG